MYVRKLWALGAVLVGTACEVPVDTGSNPPDLGVVAIAIQPKTVAVVVGDSLQLSGSVLMSNNRPPSSITWASTNASVATVSGGGLVRGVAPGSLFIRATSEGKRDSAAVTVSAPSPLPVASVTVSPSSATIVVGGTVLLVATLQDANGSALTGRSISWTSSNPGVATVSSSGLVSAASTGSATITATSEGQSASAPVSVTSVPVASVSVSPTTASVQAGQTVQLSATPKDANGNALTGRAVTWATGNGAVATVSSAGLVSGVAAGTATITATSEGHSGTATVTVTLVPVASVTVTPSPASVQVSGTIQLTATLKDANGNVLSGRTIAWRSDNAGMASVNGTGLVTGVAAGSATITATSEGHSAPVPVTVTGSQSGSGVTYYRTNFSDGTTGPLDVYAYGGGSCAKSTDYRDAGSAYSMKCTIPAIDYGAAALQAWFGNGGLANTPKDPSLDQDLFQEVKFVFAPGATQAIASTSCVGTNSNSQIKVHKSVYGQAGSAWNGWVMSEIAPCMDGPIGLFSEPEMWNMNGTETVWPGTYPSIHEGTVYDVIYRYHRYTAQGCGTIAMWVNGTKVMDSPCWSYMGTTNGSAQGLLFWDGATYLQSGLGSLSMYTLFTQATNFPIGAATASR